MPRQKTSDPKGDTLREHGTLNAKAEDVCDPLFAERAFFDARDLVQVKYEMLRRVHVDGDSVVAAVARFGLSRPTFYKAQQDLSDAGIAGLLPDKRGPRGGHKLTPEVLDFIEEKVRDRAPGDCLRAGGSRRRPSFNRSRRS